MSEQIERSEQTTERTNAELSRFRETIIEIRSKPLGQYCAEDISKVQCELGSIKCTISKIREKISQAFNCREFNWELKRKPAIVSGFNTFLANLDAEIQKVEESLKTRAAELESKKPELEKRFSNRYIPGWEPDGWKPSEE